MSWLPPEMHPDCRRRSARNWRNSANAPANEARRRRRPECSRFVPPSATPPHGRVKRKMVPPAGFGSAVNWPPCASIIEREIDSPNPMPSCFLGGSIVAALISMPDADFVFIALPGEGNQLISELARNKLTPESLKHVRTMLQRKSALLGSGQEFVFGDASGGGLHVATA